MENMMPGKGTVHVVELRDLACDVVKLLDAAGLADRVQKHDIILIKPNLVEALRPPITTPAALVAVLVEYIQHCAPGSKIIIGEGTGSRDYDTWHPFQELGYVDMARAKGIELVDLNVQPLVRKERKDCRQWPEMHLPALVYDAFLISVPVLKAHSLAGVTLTMKNMMGAAPPSHYERGGHWKKAAFHANMQEAVFDLNKYRTPDFTLLDASIGMAVTHLWGPVCDPPPQKIAASFDPVAIDAYGASLLERPWHQIGHISMANGILGMAEPLQVIKV